jgi:hypothetical protein
LACEARARPPGQAWLLPVPRGRRDRSAACRCVASLTRGANFAAVDLGVAASPKSRRRVASSLRMFATAIGNCLQPSAESRDAAHHRAGAGRDRNPKAFATCLDVHGPDITTRAAGSVDSGALHAQRARLDDDSAVRHVLCERFRHHAERLSTGAGRSFLTVWTSRHRKSGSRAITQALRGPSEHTTTLAASPATSQRASG